MSKYENLDDDELKELYLSDNSSNEVAKEVINRTLERCPITDTETKLQAIEKIAKDYSFDRFLDNKPYSCMINNKRVWFGSLDDMYYKLTGDDKYYKEYHKFYQESEWWRGCSRPTSYSDWCKMNGVKL